jgi:hypothetical protein
MFRSGQKCGMFRNELNHEIRLKIDASTHAVNTNSALIELLNSKPYDQITRDIVAKANVGRHFHAHFEDKDHLLRVDPKRC